MQGLFIGSVAKLIFAALHIAGTTIAFHPGLAAAAIFDPNEATQGTLPGNFLTTTAPVLRAPSACSRCARSRSSARV